jgi:hypothetical protein
MTLPSPTRLALLALIPALPLLGGCPVYLGSGDDDGGTVTPRSCETSRDCASGFVCRGGLCERGDDDTCRADGDLPSGQVCDDGEPLPADRCDADDDCPDGQVCDFRGTCVTPEPSGCRDGADCRAGEVCVEDRCQAVDDTCQFDFECPPGLACVDNACVGLCTDDDDCPVGQACEAGFCQEADGSCRSSAECPAGASCVGGRCLVDCGDRGVCADDRTRCSDDGFCRPDVEEGFCSDDDDCEAGSVCSDGVCRVPCPTGDDTECLAADFQLTECGPDNLCRSAAETMAECRTGADCAGDEVCANGQCR